VPEAHAFWTVLVHQYPAGQGRALALPPVHTLPTGHALPPAVVLPAPHALPGNAVQARQSAIVVFKGWLLYLPAAQRVEVVLVHQLPGAQATGAAVPPAHVLPAGQAAPAATVLAAAQ
jgi:hypothetical protein